MALLPGATLAPYEIQSPLGVGGMGEVYRARDTRLERTVAIKILPAHLSADAVRKQRLEREAKTFQSESSAHLRALPNTETVMTSIRKSAAGMRVSIRPHSHAPRLSRRHFVWHNLLA